MIIELLSQINQQPFLTRAQLKSTVDGTNLETDQKAAIPTLSNFR